MLGRHNGHSGGARKQRLLVLVLLLLLLQASLECHAFFPSVIEAGRLRINERDVPCDPSGKDDVFSISCQEYAVDLVLRGSS